MTNLTYAQLGEVAGPLNFNVNVSGSETLQLTVLNSGSTPLAYRVLFPTLQQIPNETAPTLTMSPLNGTIQPYKEQMINVTVYVPGNDKPGQHWSGIIQVVQKSNQTNPGGAVIQTGVAKLISITSTTPTGIPLLYVVSGIIIIVIAGVVYYRSRLMKRQRAAVAPSVTAAARSRARAKAAVPRRKVSKKKKTAKRKPKKRKSGSGAKKKAASRRRRR